MFNITLGTSRDENNKIKKTFDTNNDYSGTLREECSILTPSFIISTADDITQFNYAYIPEFKRYYFITDITSVREGVWRITLRCDVLMSYADSILNMSGIVLRQEEAYNLYIPDSMPEYADSYVITKKFPNSFSNTNFSYVLCTCGGGE